MSIPNQKDKLDARERILQVAEELFLCRGFDGVSIRDLTERAGVNVALVNYHFGGKRNLYLEVLERHFASAAELKLGRLGELLAGKEPMTLHRVITAYVDLHLGSDQAMQSSQQFLGLVSRQLAEDELAMDLLHRQLVRPIHLFLKTEIQALRPDLSDQQISFCIGSITAQIFHFLRCPKAYQTLMPAGDTTVPRQKVANHIVQFSLAGIIKEPS